LNRRGIEQENFVHTRRPNGSASVFFLWKKFSELNEDASHDSIFDLLCEDLKFWPALQVLISMHALADEACVG